MGRHEGTHLFLERGGSSPAPPLPWLQGRNSAAESRYVYGAELQSSSAPDAEIKSEADDRASTEATQTSKTDVTEGVCALDSGGLIRVMGTSDAQWPDESCIP
jgi:hypothetical protein